MKRNLRVFFNYILHQASLRPMAVASWLLIFTLHLLFLGYIIFNQEGGMKKKSTGKVFVRTLNLQRTETSSSSPMERKSSSQVSKKAVERVIKKNEPRKKTKRKKAINPKKKIKNREDTAKQDELLSSLKKDLANLDFSLLEEKKSDDLKVPQNLDEISTVSSFSDQADVDDGERGYHFALMQSLKRVLRLPEYGIVKIHLTLGRRGEILHMEILHSESEKNRRLFEEMLPHIRFPHFGSFFKGEEKRTFVLVLSNDI